MYVIQKTDTTDSEKLDKIKNDILTDKRLAQIANENKYGICVTGTTAKNKSNNEDKFIAGSKKRLYLKEINL